MFETVEHEIYARLRQSKAQLLHIKSLEESDDSTLEYLIKVHKGMLFISLYSVIEYCVVNSCQHFLTHLSSSPKKASSYKNSFICVLLQSEFDAIVNTGKKQIWQKKRDLIESAFGDGAVSIVNTAFPTDGSNIAYKQLQDIWSFFCVPEPILPEGVNHFLLTEIKDHRNAIAHGRKTAEEVGGRYSHIDLSKKFDCVEELSLHILNQFISHATNKTYLKESA